MRQEQIIEIRIDNQKRLLVRPSEAKFDKIYRAALGVQWDPEARALTSPVPREWGYLHWFQQILGAAADEYGVELTLVPDTLWTEVPLGLRSEIEVFVNSGWFSKLIDVRRSHDKLSWTAHRLQHAMSLAAPHWENGRYAEYVRCLDQVRDLLSPAQLKRLTIAVKRSL